MESTTVAPRARSRKPVSALGKLAAVALVIVAAMLVCVQWILIGMIIPPLMVFAALNVIFAGVIMTGWRWTPLLGVLLSGALLAIDGEPLMATVQNPTASFPAFWIGLIALAALIVSIVAGLAATVQNHRTPAEARRAPRGLGYIVTALVAIVAGAILVAAVPVSGTTADVSQDVLADLPALGAKQFEFDQKEIRVKAGETVAINLTNADAEAHFLDIDELNVHATMPAGKSALAVFKPMEPGTYTFYCHPHASPDKTEGMVGTLIVE